MEVLQKTENRSAILSFYTTPGYAHEGYVSMQSRYLHTCAVTALFTMTRQPISVSVHQLMDEPKKM
jgi:hypothetical protein